MLDTIILKLDSIKERSLFLEKELSNSEIVNNHQLYATYSKEYSKIKKIVEKYEEYKTNLDNLSSTKLLLEDSDPEIKSLAQDELNNITEQLNKNEIEIKKLLIPENEDDEKDVFLEIRAGTGGDEAGLFAGDLFRMFTRVTERKKWKIELISSRESEKGGFKEIVAKISGKQVYRFLKFESGVHRVQRVPDTESQGRVHTSACSVAVLPEVEELDSIEIDKQTTVKKIVEKLKLIDESHRLAFKDLKNVKCSVNCNYINSFQTKVTNNDEIAFFPPVTGG